MRLYAFGMLFAAVVTLGIAFAPWLWLIAVLALLRAIPTALARPLLFAHLARVVPSGHQTGVFGLFPTVGNVGGLIFPLAAASVVGYGIWAAFAIGALGYGASFLRRRPPRPGHGERPSPRALSQKERGRSLVLAPPRSIPLPQPLPEGEPQAGAAWSGPAGACYARRRRRGGDLCPSSITRSFAPCPRPSTRRPARRPEHAQIVVDHQVGANLKGHDSHGVVLLPTYVNRIDRGHIMPAAARRSSARRRPRSRSTATGASGRSSRSSRWSA